VWLANKTPDDVRSWLANPDNIILVAEIEGQLAAVGGVQSSGVASSTMSRPPSASTASARP